jgi:acetolactate synthase-1/2/3 large subunit
MPEQMTGAAATVAQLRAEGVDCILGIPGFHNMYLCDAVMDHPEMQFITGRHEQGITFMANGYARASGKIAVPFVITGPGVTNSLTPLADACADSVPMVLVASQADTSRLGHGAFHELKDQTELLAQVTKWNACAECVEQIPELVRTAFVQAYEGRPGPTAIEVPLNVQRQRGEVDIFAPPPPDRRQADASDVRRAARLLSQAKAPLLYIGSGAAWSGCTDEVIQLLTRLRAPCCVTVQAKGIVPDDHPLNLGLWRDGSGLALRFLEQADVVLVVGSSLDEADTREWTLPLPEKLIQIDTCDGVIGRHYPVAQGLVGDARSVLAQLLVELDDTEGELRPSLEASIAEGKKNIHANVQSEVSWQYMDAVQRALPRDAFVTNDASTANGWAATYLKRYLPRTFSITSNMAALGYAFPAALGAKLACPDRQALAIVGDGGFLFTAYTLATAVKYRINAVAMVFDNKRYDTIQRVQMGEFGRTVSSELHSPDFAALAQAYGASGVRAEHPEQIYDALVDAWESDGPTVIEVPLYAAP